MTSPQALRHQPYLLPMEGKMARHLTPHRHTIIIYTIRSQRLTSHQITDAAKYSRLSVSNIYRKSRMFGSARPLVHAVRPPTLTPLVLNALCEHLINQLGLYLNKMAALP